MRSLLLLFSSIALSITTASAQVSFAPEIGANMSAYSVKTAGDNIGSRLAGGLRAGAKADVALTSHFYLQPSVLYVHNGVNPPIMAGGAGTTLNISTIEAPVQLVYKFRTSSHTTPFIGAGPYIGFNVGGRATGPQEYWTPPTIPPTITRPLKIGSGADDDIKMIDAGVCGNLGLQLPGGLYALVYYQQGFVNLQPQGDSNNSLKSFNLGISLGYFFHCNHAKKATAEKK